MPNYELEGQIACVTGGARGIGRAIAQRLASEGCKVTVADLDEAGAAETATAIRDAGGEAFVVPVDVTDKVTVDQMITETVTHFGGLDIQVNNAGIAALAPLLTSNEEMWDALMNVNAKGVLFCAQAAAQQMIKQGRGGRIINNASAAGKGRPGGTPLGVYAASKYAVVGLTKQMGFEWAQYGILVNAVCPGIVDTPMWELIDRETAQLNDVPVGSVLADAVSRIPAGRIEQPEDVANMVAFLVSADASYLTAQAYNVCGGIMTY